MSLANSSKFSVSASHDEQGLLYPFAFTDEEALPVGKYAFNYGRIEYDSDSRKLFGYTLGFQHGGFYNGDRTEYSLDLRYRAQPWGNFTLRFVQNDLKFPEAYGSTKLFLLGPQFELNFSRDLFWTTFLQYNTQQENFNINSRLQWRFKPLSDLLSYILTTMQLKPGDQKNRGLVVKMNYWINL